MRDSKVIFSLFEGSTGVSAFDEVLLLGVALALEASGIELFRR
jgi:hypothetical protein